jgi:hypothetical protein
MLNEGLVHFVESDAYDLIRRPPRLDDARKFLVNQFDEERLSCCCRLTPGQ